MTFPALNLSSCHDTNGVIKSLLVDNPAYIGLTDSATEVTTAH